MTTEPLATDTVHVMDCLTALSRIPDASVTTVITDPPYPNGMGLFRNAQIDGLAALYLSCKKATRYVVFFWRPSDVPRPPPGWYENARHIWHKPDARSTTHYEAVVVWGREPKRHVSRVWTVPILSLRSLGDWKPHPTQKPVQLVRYLVEHYTNEGDTVLDPFLGSGTTAVACKQLKRHWIGIEHDPEYAAIAVGRLQPRKHDTPDDENTEAPQERQEHLDTFEDRPTDANESTVDERPRRKRTR